MNNFGLGKKKVLFLCTHNSCRSQIAEGLLRDFGNDNYESFSAGVKKTTVHTLAIKVMDEVGIDISNQFSKHIEEFKGTQFDYVVTVCDNAKEICPFFPGKNVIHQSFKDPGLIDGTDEEKLKAFRKTRDEIKQWSVDTFSD